MRSCQDPGDLGLQENLLCSVSLVKPSPLPMPQFPSLSCNEHQMSSEKSLTPLLKNHSSREGLSKGTVVSRTCLDTKRALKAQPFSWVFPPS